MVFLRKEEKICSYAPKGWVSGKRSIRHSNEFVVYLKTQYFVGMPAIQLLDVGARYYYYLGLRTSVSKSKVMVPIETVLEIIALGVQVNNLYLYQTELIRQNVFSPIFWMCSQGQTKFRVVRIFVWEKNCNCTIVRYDFLRELILVKSALKGDVKPHIRLFLNPDYALFLFSKA